MMHDDKPGSPLSRNVSPNPLHEDAHAKAGLGQKLQMHHSPCEPRQDTAAAELAALQNGKALSDDRHIALVEIAEWPGRRLAGDAAFYQPASVAALLHCHLRHARQRLTILIR
jgi:hypothetical protein